MNTKKAISFLTGFVILFAVYHFPEFFQAFWIMAVFKIGFLLVAFIIARLQGWKGLAGFGLAITPGCWINLVKGIFTGIVAFAFSILLSVLLGYEHIISFPGFQTIVKQLPLLLLMTAIPSVAEDILTRGYLFGHLKMQFGKNAWILISTAVYVLNHIWRLNEGAAVLTYLFLLGLVLAYCVWITKSLWLAFGIHWGANIAYESTNTLIQTESLVSHQGNTWVLAVIWGILFLLLRLFTPAAKEYASFRR